MCDSVIKSRTPTVLNADCVIISFHIVFTKQRRHLTKLVKVCVHSVGPRDGTHQSGFEECCPFVGQTPQPTHIILEQPQTWEQNKWQWSNHDWNKTTVWVGSVQWADRTHTQLQFPAVIGKTNRWASTTNGRRRDACWETASNLACADPQSRLQLCLYLTIIT